MWHAVKTLATKRQYWFQRDGVGCQVTALCLQFLASKYGDRVIFRNTEHHWPPYSPDLFQIYFPFRAKAMNHLCRRQTSTLHDLKIIVDNFADNIDKAGVKTKVALTKRREELC